MLKKNRRALALAAAALLALPAAVHRAVAQGAATSYPRMAPVEQYLMDRPAEIALARTAAPPSISRDAGVVVLGRHGYQTAVESRNGFVCYVGRGWSSAADPDYWNPRVRVPMCLNAPAADSYFRMVEKITDLALAGRSLAQVNAALATAVAHGELSPMAPGSIGYMLGKEGYGGDVAPHWPSHVMFFYSDAAPAMWGANLPGSPMIAIADPSTHLTQFVIMAQKWSDGTSAVPAPHEHR
jgi:hypothetical protein